MSAFSGSGLPVKIELNLGGTWTDVTTQAYVRDTITIKRGQANEGQGTDPSLCDLTFNNRNGQFSPRNPTGAYYGLIGRNTPLRLSANLGNVRLRTPGGGTTDGAVGADNAGLHITGDIDIRFDGNRDGWGAMTPDVTSATGFDICQLVAKGNSSGNYGYILGVDRGNLILLWSPNGTTLNSITANVPLQQTSGRQAVRVTFQVNNGAGGCTATFYTAPTSAGPWTQVGDPRIAAFTTSIFASTANLVVQYGDNDSNDAQIYSAQVLSGIGGTAKANPDFTAQAAGTTSFTDSAGTSWTLAGTAAIDAWRTRFVGEVSSWPSVWDLSGNDVSVSVEAAGILRRLNQGTAPLHSPYYRGMTSRAGNVVAYWPVEDLSGATQIAGGIANENPMRITGAPQLSTNAVFGCSDPLPALASASLTGVVPGYSAAGFDGIACRFLMLVPAGGLSSNATIISVYSGQLRFDLVYGAAGANTLGLNATNLATGASAGTTGLSGPWGTLDNSPFLVSVEAHTSGSMGIVVLQPGATSGLTTSTSFTGSLGTVSAVVVNPGLDSHALTVGHVSVQQSLGTLPITELVSVSGATIGPLNGFVGEPAGARFARLSSEQGVAWSQGGGYLFSTTAMGSQASQAAFLDLIQACIDADGAILLEPREKAAIRFRSAASLYSQPFVVTLPYGDTNSLAPTDDDALTRNDITIQRTNGSSIRVQQTTGPLNTATPPAGVGVYATSLQLNLATDAQLSDVANWALHLGTYDATRYPKVGLELASTPFTSSSTLTSAVLDLDQGDVFTITGLPAWMPPDAANLMAIGFTEVIEPYGYQLTINSVPADPWTVGIYDQGGVTGTRYSSDGSTLAAGVSSAAASLSVATPSGPLWTTSAGDMPFDIRVAGERMTVTAISGTTSPQTFTVTRSINGVVKAQASGAAVALFAPAVYAL